MKAAAVARNPLPNRISTNRLRGIVGDNEASALGIPWPHGLTSFALFNRNFSSPQMRCCGSLIGIEAFADPVKNGEDFNAFSRALERRPQLGQFVPWSTCRQTPASCFFPWR